VAITMKDVAKAAGVSVTTVSFVLNETPGQSLRADTVQRVQDAAQALGYTPSRIARALREGSSRVVLLRTGSLRGSGLSTLIDGLQDELHRHGYTLIVTQDEAKDADLLATLAPRHVIALDPPWPTVASDDRRESEMGRLTATQLGYLLDTGHRHIGFACPSVGLLVEVRLAQARRFLKAAGVPPPVPLVLPDDQPSLLRALDGFRRQHPQITAIAAFTDHEAIRLLAATSALGIAVPDELAIIGFDEDEAGAWWTPALTTVKIDADSYGRRMANFVLGLADEPWQGQPSKVIVRQSA